MDVDEWASDSISTHSSTHAVTVQRPTERLLLYDQKESICEFPVLEEVVYDIVRLEPWSPRFRVANCKKDTVRVGDGKDFDEHESEEEAGPEG